MKILMVSGSLPPMRCGVGDYTDALATALNARPGVDVAVLTSLIVADAPPPAYVRFATIPSWTVRDGYAHVVRTMRAWRPDIVHLQYPTLGYDRWLLPSIVPMLASRMGAVPVRTWHEAFNRPRAPAFLIQSVMSGPAIVVRPNFRDLMWAPLRPVLDRRRIEITAGAASLPRATASPPEIAALRDRYRRGRARLIMFFGFVYPAKGVDQIFEIADPERDAIVIVGDTDVDPAYGGVIRALAADGRWSGYVSMPGFLPVDEAANLLAAADMVVLPFVAGGGSWNSSISAAVLQGTPVVTTSNERHGLAGNGQVYFARPGDKEDLRHGMTLVNRSRMAAGNDDGWQEVADRHLSIYSEALANARKRAA